MSDYKYKCGFCGVVKGKINDPCPQHMCQKVQDDAKAAAQLELGHGFMERDSEVDERLGFIRGYYFAKLKDKK